jgi:hypothetical protein
MQELQFVRWYQMDSGTAANLRLTAEASSLGDCFLVVKIKKALNMINVERCNVSSNKPLLCAGPPSHREGRDGLLN